jgi:bifunctional non-homologous end joining protein LigD
MQVLFTLTCSPPFSNSTEFVKFFVQKELPTIYPVPLVASATPFNDQDWLFEIKYDGIRALAYVIGDECQLASENLTNLKGFDSLCAAIVSGLNARDTVLDGEIVSMDENGVINFANLVERKGRLSYFAFDLPILNGRDQRDLPLIERKRRLKEVIPSGAVSLHYADYIAGNGVALYEMAVKNDIEGIVAKPRDSLYVPGAIWYEINTPGYSQAARGLAREAPKN